MAKLDYRVLPDPERPSGSAVFILDILSCLLPIGLMPLMEDIHGKNGAPNEFDGIVFLFGAGVILLLQLLVVVPIGLTVSIGCWPRWGVMKRIAHLSLMALGPTALLLLYWLAGTR